MVAFTRNLYAIDDGTVGFSGSGGRVVTFTGVGSALGYFDPAGNFISPFGLGSMLLVGGGIYIVATVDTPTQVTLAHDKVGSTAAGQSFILLAGVVPEAVIAGMLQNMLRGTTQRPFTEIVFDDGAQRYRWVVEGGQLVLKVGTTGTENANKAAISIDPVTGKVSFPLSDTGSRFAGPALTLTAPGGVPVVAPDADVIAATNVFVAPAQGNYLETYDVANARWVMNQHGMATIDVSSAANYAAGTCHSVIGFLDAGVPKFGTQGWQLTTGEGTGPGSIELEQFEGRLVNKHPASVRIGGVVHAVAARQGTFAGGFSCSANGATEDSKHKRLLSNINSVTVRPLARRDSTASYAYQTAAWAQVGANGNNACDIFHCIAGRPAELGVEGAVFNSTGLDRQVTYGFGLDVTNAVAVDCATKPGLLWGGRPGFPGAKYSGFPGKGRHSLTWLWYGDATGGGDVQTWYLNSGIYQAMLQGWTLN